jgi:uncharacterized membrane protein SpoIIM required for sporulation
VNIERFIAEHTPAWQKLNELLGRAENTKVTREELGELVALYRRTCSDLNRARSYTANPEVLGYLNQLTGRAYRFIYQAAHETPVTSAFVKLLTREIPSAFRRERLAIAVAASALLLGVLFGALAVTVDPANGQRLVPSDVFTESPRERVAKIETDKERIDNLDKALAFGASLYTHNIEVAFLAFSLGALTIAGGVLLLFYNGVILGAIAASYILDGVPLFFFAWVGPHGALELPAIVFAGAAGLVAGRAFLMPGDLSRAASMRGVLPAVWRIIIGTALTLVFAGLIEGSFSQFSSRTFPYVAKIAVAALLFVALMTYLFLRRVEAN